MAAYRRTEQGRKKEAKYNARLDRKRRQRELERRRAGDPEYRAHKRAYRRTARARVLNCRRQARMKLRRATSDQARRRLAALIEMYDRELLRMGPGDCRLGRGIGNRR